MKDFTSAKDATDLAELVQLARDIKADPFKYRDAGKDKTMVLLFFNPSLRTRLSTEKAALNLGMQVISMNADQGWTLEFEEGAIMNAGSAEHVKEAAAVVSQYADIIGIRTFPGLKDREKDYSEQVIEAFKRYASVPIISLESATRHPLQSLADVITIEEFKKKDRPKVVLSWAPHVRALPQAVPNSFVEWMKIANVDLVVTNPEGYELADEFMEGVQLEYDQKKAFEGADFVYAKNWSSYREYGQILNQDPAWTITQDKLVNWANDARFMHCLPVRRNVVVEDAVLDGPNSIVIAQANNRTWAAQAVVKKVLEGL
ncbi:N-acetylornithine carbamoyltransferase [Haliscomenobacter sp.]|uniref:N-acetylornithine carbamoyltransferase n=1 Tax=Haliscomenobacter sp. TaxID=2717303 RepID=UPI0035930ECD